MKKQCKTCHQYYDAGWWGRKKCQRCEGQKVNDFLNGRTNTYKSLERKVTTNVYEYYPSDLSNPLNPLSPFHSVNSYTPPAPSDPVDTSHHSSSSHSSTPSHSDYSYSSPACDSSPSFDSSPSCDTSFTSDFGGGDVSGNY